MRVTVSIPTAMQCSFSSLPVRTYVTSVLFAVLLLTVQGCRTTSSTIYLPTAERERLSLTEGGATLRQFLELECPATTRESQVVARVLLSDRGEVLESALEGTSGSSSVDGIIGAVTAQLTLADREPLPRGQARVRVQYSCGEPVTAALELVDS